MAIFDEQVLEPFVAKGIGNSGVASRQIQATNLPDLSAAVRQSQMTQQNLSDQQSATLKALAIKNYKAPSISSAVKDSGDMTKPFVIGKVAGSSYTPSGYTVAVPDGKGSFNLKTYYTSGINVGLGDTGFEKSKQVLDELGIDTSKDYPEIGISGLSGTYKKNDLINTLLAYSKGKAQSGTGINLSDILKQIG